MVAVFESSVKKATLIAVSVIWFLGCSPAVVKPTGNVPTNMKPEDVTTLIYKMGRQCWTKEWGWFNDGVVVELNLNDIRGQVVSARRVAPDLGRLEPFFLAIVSQEQDGSSIETRELDCEGCALSNSADIKRWIAGDLTCTEKHNK